MKCTQCGFAGHDVLFSGTVCKKCAGGAPVQQVAAPVIPAAQPKPVYSCTRCNRVSSCAPCLFTAASLKSGKPVCKVCAGKATHEEVAEIKANEAEQAEAFATANQHSLLGTKKMQRLRDLARSVAHLPGSFAELGVYKGGSAFLLASDHPSRALHLFDTFEGMPISGEGDHHPVGDFNDTSLEAVQSLLAGKKVLFHQGLFPATTKNLKDEQYAFVHIDADQYQSTVDACTYFWPRMATGGIMLFDDYEWKNCPGVKRAMQEFSETYDIAIQAQGNFQAVFQKTAKRPHVTVHSACKGIGDAICTLYACAGIAAAGYEVFYYARHTVWMNRVSIPGVHILNAEALPVPPGSIDLGARYSEQLKNAVCRKEWYCDNFCIAKGLPLGSIKPLVPNMDKIVHAPREDAGQYVVMAASSIYKSRDWDNTQWPELARLLAADGIKTIAIDRPDQETRVKAIFGDTAEYFLSYDVGAISDLILQARAFISIDSGMSHFAALLGAPTVAIMAALPRDLVFGLTDVKAVTPDDFACSPCRFDYNGGAGYTRACDTGCKALKSISAPRVYNAVMEMMS